MTLPGVFTVLRMENHEVPLFSLHVDRLFWGFRAARWPHPPSREAIARALRRALRDLPAGSLRVRVVFTPAGVQTTWQPVGKVPNWTFRRALPIPFTAFKRWKVGSWEAFWKAQERAVQQGYDEALLVHQGRVVSLARANLIAFLDGRWVSPRHPEATCGVMRRFLSRMLKATRQPLVFHTLTVEDLMRGRVVAGINAVRLFLPLALGAQDLEPLENLWKQVEPAYRQTRVRLKCA